MGVSRLCLLKEYECGGRVNEVFLPLGDQGIESLWVIMVEFLWVHLMFLLFVCVCVCVSIVCDVMFQKRTVVDRPQNHKLK
jgi:hypothetical protein